DIVFIYREALMLGSSYFEKRFRKTGAKIILDFDDAIWLRDVSRGNNNLAWLKNPSKTARIIRLCDLVITGNDYLKEYALQYNKNVLTIPTTIDTDYYIKTFGVKPGGKVCVGWTGSLTTLKHLELSLPFLRKIKEKYGDSVIFRIISDFPFASDEIVFDFVKWSREAEVQDLSYFDIGIMPLPDDEWAKGKCGFKGLQYMALEIPAIMSPVGVNTEIIQDGVNGFLAANTDEWVEKLSMLIESPALREKLGKAGRQSVLEKYSFESQKQHYLKCFQELVKT
ncbi:MAG: glycosyl transferase family 1, partial [Odoribacter sp.]|nr:glycosyl transferase family 1 [Odoribacter sp.]